MPTTFDKAYTLGNGIKNVDGSNRSAAIKITGNKEDNSIIGGKGADTLEGLSGDDTLKGGEGKDLFIYSGGNDVIADYTVADKISVDVGLTYQDFEISGDDVILNYGEGNSLKIAGSKNTTINLNSVAKIYTEEGIFDSKKSSATLASSITDFDATKYSALVTINGTAAGAVPIIGNAKANKIFAGDNGSTINGGIGNDTLTGGKGSDVFVYGKGDGNDVIQGYGEGDKISLGSDVVIIDATMKSGDAVIKVDSSSIIVKNSSEITLTAGGEDTVFSNGLFVEDNSVKAPASFKGTIDLSKYSVQNIDASLAKNAISIQGGVSDDSLIGGTGKDVIYGNAGADTLWGGKSNDTLWGGEGNDSFIYKVEEGTDIIMDFTNNDLLTILKSDGSAGSFSNANFNSSTLNLTIEGGGNVTFKNVDASTDFNINGTTYHVSGKTLVK